jgi:hypothetical protein
MRRRSAFVMLAALSVAITSACHAQPSLVQIGEFIVPDANQGIGVDAQHFYAVDNRSIGKYDKTTGKLVKAWRGDKKGPIKHLDGSRGHLQLRHPMGLSHLGRLA